MSIGLFSLIIICVFEGIVRHRSERLGRLARGPSNRGDGGTTNGEIGPLRGPYANGRVSGRGGKGESLTYDCYNDADT